MNNSTHLKNASVDEPVSEAVKRERFRLAQKEFDQMVERVMDGEKTTHDLAMWLHDEGYRLEKYSAAVKRWWEMVDARPHDAAEAYAQSIIDNDKGFIPNADLHEREARAVVRIWTDVADEEDFNLARDSERGTDD